MIGFGDLKNNLQLLRKYVMKMDIIESCKLKMTDFDQHNLRKNGIKTFLILMNYNVIQLYPTIKVVNDRKFVQSCFTIARKLFAIDPQISPEHFLISDKFFQKKVQFISQLLKKAFHSVNDEKKKANSKSQKAVAEIVSKQSANSDSEDQPREIIVQPTTLQSQNYKKEQQPKLISLGSPSVNKMNKNCRPFPKEHTDSQQQSYQQIINLKANFNNQKKRQATIKSSNYNPKVQLEIQNHFKDQECSQTDTISRQQFQNVLQLLTTVNNSLNGMVQKFDDFQNQVRGWVHNVNARVGLLEENFKIIKDNL